MSQVVFDELFRVETSDKTQVKKLFLSRILCSKLMAFGQDFNTSMVFICFCAVINFDNVSFLLSE